MSGGSIAYHLRENKAIERNLFIKTLEKISLVRNISDYTYVGFGGPFLEDFKVLHAALRITKMISLEYDKNVVERQKFNSPLNKIKITECDSGTFLTEHQFEGPHIVWLDYVDPQKLYSQLSEFHNLLSKLAPFDIAKITLNANPQTLGGPPGPGIQNYRRNVLLDRLGDFGTFDLEDDDLTNSNYSKTLLKSLHSAVSRLATGSANTYFQPLTSFVYKDSGHKMLTVTGIMLSTEHNEEKNCFFNTSRINHWPFKNLDWDSPPIEISVPALSAKERMKLDEILPISEDTGEVTIGKFLVNYLGYPPGETSEVEKLLENYAKFYRAYPFFSRVVL